MVEQVCGSFEFFRFARTLYFLPSPFLALSQQTLESPGTVLGAGGTEMNETHPRLQSPWESRQGSYTRTNLVYHHETLCGEHLPLSIPMTGEA